MFYIGQTLKGFSWTDGDNLSDKDRYFLLERCQKHWEDYEREMKKAQRGK